MIDYSGLQRFATDNRVNYNELCAVLALRGTK